jgi:hypothetical protein
MKTRQSLQLSNPILLFVLLATFMLAASILTGERSGAARAARDLQSAGIQKVILEKGSPAANLPGVTLWHDYGSFALYRVEGTGLDSLAAASPGGILATSAELDPILLDAHSFNPLVDKVDLPPELNLVEPSGLGLQLVQFVGPIKAEWLESIQAAGGIPVHYIANNAYLIWADSGSRSQMSAMAAQGDFLQYSAAYQPHYKLGPALREKTESGKDPGEVVTVVVQMYRHADRAASEGTIERLSLGQLTPWYDVMEFQNAVFELRIGDLSTIARLPDVTSLALRPERELFDEVQGQILAGDFAPGNAGPSAPGYLAWLAGLGFSQDPAEYPIVDVTDDGIGNGTVNSGDSTLHVAGSLSNPTRLAYIHNCTAEANGGGPGGHGHINASIVGGYDTRTGAAFNDADGFNLGLGINPYGRVAGTRVFGGPFDLSACGNSDTGLIQATYNSGARISSNSWGCGESECASLYDASSQAYDAGTRDAVVGQAGNQQLTFVFAAGNDGPDLGTVGTPGNAKNVITVGASENDRPTWTDGCLVSPSGANNAMDIIGFSSRGPVPGSRVKPEVVAPGTHIQGTASTNAGYSGASVCDQYQPDDQEVFAASSGTSHSTPAVAGVVSLYYHWLENNYSLPAPSPAMLKAYLIAHPTYLTGVSANDTLPSNKQGFGMPNLGLAFDDASRYLLDQTVTFNNSGETWTLNGGVVDPAEPVRIVLAYTDQAGAIGTSPQVNDLNLSVQVGGGTYLGNRFTGAWSTAGGAPDSKNNYEAIFLPAGTSGNLDITVTAFNIAGNGVPNSGDGTDQDFALVCYNCAEEPGFSLSVTPGSQSICTLDESQAVYQVSIESILGYNSAVTLNASGQPAGSSTTFIPNPVIPAGNSELTLAGIGAGLSGSYTLAIEGESSDQTRSASASLILAGAQPGKPALQSPANGAQDQSLSPAFSWTAGSQAAGYEIQIATDSQFANIVDSSTGIPGTSYVPPAGLQSGKTYYWRVRATNACGGGAYSSVFNFTTESLPGDCPVGTIPSVLYQTDFEANSAGWSHSGTGDTWELSNARSHSGTKAFFATDVASVSDQYLVSPQVTLPAGQASLSLQYWNYQEIEANSFGSLCYDGAILEISKDGGANWFQMDEQNLLTDPYHALVAGSFGNPLAGREAWCGDPQDWINSIVALDDYAGQAVRFRFRLGTDQITSREGWYVDDVVVQSCQNEGLDHYFLPVVGRADPPE